MSDRLKGARVLVLGGSSGIGLATAAAAAADGAIVTIASLNGLKGLHSLDERELLLTDGRDRARRQSHHNATPRIE
jgi:NAD(P)-dependent dehydrogenase (short-subunit alcohol dehydrogenase family)